MKLNLINHSKMVMPRKFIHSWVDLLCRDFRRQKVRQVKALAQMELSVIFLDPLPAKKLNRQYRGRDYATDILSFAGEGSKMQNLAELVLCPQVIRKQAREHNLSFREELGYMIVHGVLHLLGYDHERSRREEKIMFRIQDQVFASTLAKVSGKKK